MEERRPATIKQILDRAPKRAEQVKPKEEIINQIWDDLGVLFNKCGKSSGEGWGKMLPLEDFPYLEEDRMDAPFYHIRVLPDFDEKAREYSVVISVKPDDQVGFKQLLRVRRNSIEDPLGRVITGKNDLERTKLLVNKIVDAGLQHLPKTHTK